jgi:hypothetical protein
MRHRRQHERARPGRCRHVGVWRQNQPVVQRATFIRLEMAEADHADHFSIYLARTKFGPRTDAAALSFQLRGGQLPVYGRRGGPLSAASRLPNVYNKLQQLHVDVRHRRSNRLVRSGTNSGMVGCHDQIENAS